MNNLNDIKAVYLIGIGGIGMSALARYFKQAGKEVAGYDKTSTPLTQQLQQEDITIDYSDDIENIPSLYKTTSHEQILVIYTPAIPAENKTLNYFKDNNYKLHKRAEILGMITNELNTIAVAGSHGKTSISVILAWIMKHSQKSTVAFMGGISKNLNSNLMLPDGNQATELVVAEADEFDRSFLHMKPNTAIITAIDADHLDIYENKQNVIDAFRQFAEKINPTGTLIIKKSVSLQLNKKPKHNYTYALEQKADFYAENLKLNTTNTTFDLICPNLKIENLQINIPGKMNAENAIGASAAAIVNGASAEEIREALATWQGVQRRFDYIINTDDFVFINDYAHHPQELKTLIETTKQLYPDKKITAIFQPHLYTRTRDFASEFAEELSKVNEVIINPIYPAREKPIPNITAKTIFDKITISNKKIIAKEDLTKILKYEKNKIVLTIGAGNIVDIVEPLKETFLKQKNCEA